MEQHQYRHHLAVAQTAGTIKLHLPGTSTMCFFQFRNKIFAKFVENKKIIY
jgi:hypothetical protein